MEMIRTKVDPESRLFRGYWQDGSIDLAAGLALVTTGVFWLTGPAIGQSLAPVVAFIIYPILRKKVTDPRLGHVRFNAKRRSRLLLGHWLMVAIGLATLGLGVGLYLARGGAIGESSLAATLVPGLPAALVGLMSVGGAAMLGLLRFLVYALLLVMSGAAVVVLEAHPGWALLAGGVAVTVWGSVMMLRFVRAYPVVTPEME